jgi:hypothetical protein
VVLAPGDFVNPLRYRQIVDGLRPDMVAVFTGFGTERFMDLLDRCRANGRPAYMVELLPAEERAGVTGRFAAKVSPAPVLGKPAPQYAAYTNMAGQAALLGYDLPSDRVRRGGVFSVRLYWQALADMDKDYQFFARLITPSGHILAQVERQPVSTWLPTSAWWPGAAFSDDVRLQIPADAEAGTYNLEVAWELSEDLLPLVRQGYQEVSPIMLRQIVIEP